MKIAIIHLSDIHLRKNENAIITRIAEISGVLRAWCSEHSDLKNCFIVVTGDIASSGNSKEYEEAITFFTDLDERMKEGGMLHDVEYIVVPGNHDCNLQVNKESRNLLITDVLDKKKITIDDSIIDTLTTEQQEFFDFVGALSPGICSTPLEKLYHERNYTIDEYKIRFCCYNTAWMSQPKEKPGQIMFPCEKISNTDSECNLICAVFHHPYGWFESENGQYFKKHIESTTDIIFTGHEHDIYSYTKEKLNGEVNDYMEGGRLQSPNISESSFNGAIIDFENKLYKRTQLSWNGDAYLTSHSTEWESLPQSKSLKRNFENNERFKNSLDDLGIGLTHRYKDNLRLSDIFVYPELYELGLDSTDDIIPLATITSDKVIDYVLANNRLLMIGANLSGKTSLLKALYREFLDRGLIPVLIKGEQFNSHRTDKIAKLIDECFSEQYSGNMLEKYRQLDKNIRVLLIDDFDKSELNYKGKNILLDFVQNMFGRILISGTDLLKAEEFAPPVHTSLLSFKHCHLAEFGHLLRNRLIIKWLSLGREYIISDIDLDIDLKFYVNNVDRMIGEKLLPPNPFVILTILQTIEAGTPLDTASGSYGHLYEAVITNAILRSSDRVDDLQKKYDFLSSMAYYLFNIKQRVIKTEQITEVEDAIFEKHDIRIDAQRITRELLKVNILSYQDGYYSFKYMYYYYYFVARYMSNYLRDPDEGSIILKTLEMMSKNLFREEYANILIFLCFKSSDPLVYEAILRNTKEIFKGINPCDLDGDVAFINSTQLSEPKLSLEKKSVEETRDNILREKDEIGRASNNTDTTYDIDIVSDINKLDPILQLNVAFKSIQILGQILRNFPTKLSKEVKSNLTEECFSIGLRTLMVFLGWIQEDLDNFYIELGKIIRKQLNIDDEDEIKDMVRKFTFIIPVSFAFTIIKTVSHAIGSEELTETFNRVTARWSTTATRLIYTSIRLDNFQDLPTKEIVSLHNDLGKNYCSSTLLNLIVIENMFLYHWPPRKQQSILAKLDVRVQDPRLIEGPSKKLPRG